MEVLYEDNHLLVVYKDRGILAQADGSSKPDILTLSKLYLKEKYQKPGNVYLGLVHRLDINTEGIMVLARTSKAASRLSEDIKNNLFSKRYLAVVEGRVNKGVITSFLAKDEVKKISYISKDGKYARLSYKSLLEKEIEGTLVTICDIILETGRFHQIRCQFQSIGHPLYGDKKYGSKNQALYPTLQAYQLSFRHPVTKENLTFTKLDNKGYFKGVEAFL